MTDKFSQAISLFDEANAKDPNLDNGQAKELLYAQRMSEKLADFNPQASDHLKLAARAQHIERWTSKRSDYPEGRSGYKKWRAELMLFHAARAGELMAEAGYEEQDIERVKYLIQKRSLRRDEETQCLEDVICLVFLEFYLEDFAKAHAHDYSEEKFIDIIQKTWNKMSDKGHEAALQLPLKDELLALIKKALA